MTISRYQVCLTFNGYHGSDCMDGDGGCCRTWRQAKRENLNEPPQLTLIDMHVAVSRVCTTFVETHS